jgi:hypothetical protein
MRPAISLDSETGTTRLQTDEPWSYHFMLGCLRNDYERADVKKTPVVKLAEATWFDARSTADKLKDASEAAFRIEMLRRGYAVAGKILSGKYHDSLKKKHKRKKRKGN